MSPLRTDLQPGANIPKIVKAALPSIQVWSKRNAERILVVLDNESRAECAGWREALEAAFQRPCQNAGIADVRVVLKVQMFENWLVSDPSAMQSMPARFNVSNAIVNRITPDKADRVDALRILKDSAHNEAYDKIRDAMAIMSKLDPYAGAANSRSLRRFLRLAGCRMYAQQSGRPG